MLYYIMHFLHGVRCSQPTELERQCPCSPDLTTELDDWHRFSFSSLMAFLAILAMTGPKDLLPVALTLLIYAISLRLAIMNPLFLHDFPSLARFLHTIPLLGTFCMAGITLVSNVHPPTLGVAGLLLGTLPLMIMAVYHGVLLAEASAAKLPKRMHPPTPVMSSSAGTTDPPV